MLKFQTRYVAIGFWNTLFSLFIFRFFLNIFSGYHYQILLLITFLISNIQSHSMQRRFAFKSKKPYKFELFRFFLGSFLAYFLNALLLHLMMKFTNLEVFNSQVLITILLIFFSYFLHKKLIFN